MPQVTAVRGLCHDPAWARAAARYIFSSNYYICPKNSKPLTRTLLTNTHAMCRQASKQLSIRRLPPLLAVHVKRFEHFGSGGGTGAGSVSGLGVGGVTRKIQTRLVFPTGQLDMSPYTSAVVLRCGVLALAATEGVSVSAVQRFKCICGISFVRFSDCYEWVCAEDALMQLNKLATSTGLVPPLSSPRLGRALEHD